MYKRLFEIDPWKISTKKFQPVDKRLQESITSIGNGYMGSRGMFEETYSGDTHQGLYLAGVWFPDKTRVGWWKNGYPDYFGKVINACNFIGVDILLNGTVVDLFKVAPEDFFLELNMKNGLLKREFIYSVEDTKVKITFERFFSIVQKELSCQKISLTVLKGNPEISFVSQMNGNVYNEDSNYDEIFWEDRGCGFEENFGFLSTETKDNPFNTPRYTVTYAMDNRFSEPVKGLEQQEEMFVAKSFSLKGEVGKTYSLEKFVWVVTSRDVTLDQLAVAKNGLKDLEKENFTTLLKAQSEAWKKRWDQADVKIFGSDEAQQGIRFNMFQLFSTYYGEDARLNVGPKGFTGEKYGGATYWDTEACIVPMYLSVTPQEVTKKLLEYRYKQLDGAFINAKRQGLKGALYPMVTFTGVECHNEWEITFEEIHRNGTIAYAIYNYTRYTGDEEYVTHDGFDVLTGIARFWADRVHYSQRKGLYMIHGVTGPNEYENNVNNNWYTNMLAKWCLNYTNEIADKVSDEKLAELGLTEEERNKWHEIADNMYLPEDKELGIFVQHDTFLDKDLTPVADIPADQLPLNQNWSWDKILRSPYIKQGDVMQGIWYFIDKFPEDVKKRNFEFYEPLTVHESSLSPSVHAIIAADLHKEDKAVEMYSRTARLDLDNYNNDTNDGLHITSMTGSWLAIVQGFAGMRVIDDELQFSPFVPKDWEGYNFRINFRDRLLEVTVNKEGSSIKLLKGDDLTIKLNGESLTLTTEK